MAPRLSLLLAVAAELVAGCSDTVDPTLGIDVPYSLYGYLDPTADQQAVRVVPIQDRMDAPVDTLDAAVTSTDLATGETRAWRDSLVTFSDGSQGHVFVADLTPRPGGHYRIEARRSDGATSAVEIRIPPLVAPTVGRAEFQNGGIGYPIRIEGAPHVLNSTFQITVAGHPEDPPGVARRLDIPIGVTPTESAPGVWEIDIPFVTATRRALESQGLLGLGLGLVSLEYTFFVTEAEWDPPSTDPDVLVEPGTFTNVAGGLGFVGSGYATSVRWMASPDAAIAAGFRTGDDPAASLVINELSMGPSGWVELYNPTLGDVPLRGYSLTNSAATPRLQPITAPVVVPAGGFTVINLDFPLTDMLPTLEIGLYGRTGELVLHVAPLWLYPEENATYGSYPDGYSRIVRQMVGLSERIFDLFRGPLRPTPGAPNDLGVEVASINEIYTEGAGGWVETVTAMPGVDSLTVIYEPDLSGATVPATFLTAASPVIPSDVGAFGVAAERPPALVLEQAGGTVFLLAFYRDVRIFPTRGREPIALDPTLQLRAVDARRFGGQVPGQSVGYLPSAPTGTWTPGLRPTRGTPNTLSRLGL